MDDMIINLLMSWYKVILHMCKIKNKASDMYVRSFIFDKKDGLIHKTKISAYAIIKFHLINKPKRET